MQLKQGVGIFKILVSLHNEISLLNATQNYATGLVTQLTTISSADLSSASDCAHNKDIFLDLQSQKAPFRDIISRLALLEKVFV